MRKLIFIADNKIGDEGVKLVANALEENETLTSINLCREFNACKVACKASDSVVFVQRTTLVLMVSS
jgi:hypothetical protein